MRITNALIRLRGSADWPAPLLFPYNTFRFFCDVANFTAQKSERSPGRVSGEIVSPY